MATRPGLTGFLSKWVYQDHFENIISFFSAEQFRKSLKGDRFFFTHKDQVGSFTRQGRRNLLQRTLAGIICDNTDIARIPANVFLLTDPDDFINCDDTQALNKNRVEQLLKFQLNP